MTTGAMPARPLRSVGPERSVMFSLVAALFVAPFILLPFDWGFPRIPVLGRPLNPAAAISLAMFGVLLVRSRGLILRELRRPYCMLQTAYFALLILESLRAVAPLVALQQSLVYFCTFVLNYVILLYLIRRGGSRPFVLAVVVVGLVAALIGIVQAVFGIQIGAYRVWYDSYFHSSGADPLAAGSRSVGTLNNPILYGMAMVLLVPYLMEVRQRWLQAAAFSIVFVAGAFTGTRTVILVGGVFLCGGFGIYRWRMLWLIPAMAVVLLIGAQMLGGWREAGRDPRVRFLAARFGLIKDESIATAKGNIAIRQEALRHGAREVIDSWGPVTWVVGKGMLSAVQIGQKVSAEYNTVDNAFFGIFYEKGLVGLTLFVLAFGRFLRRTRVMATRTMHWWGPIGLLAAGMAFNFDSFSTFIALAIGSMAVVTVRAEQGRPGHTQPTRRPTPIAPPVARDLPGESLESA